MENSIKHHNVITYTYFRRTTRCNLHVYLYALINISIGYRQEEEEEKEEEYIGKFYSRDLSHTHKPYICIYSSLKREWRKRGPLNALAYRTPLYIYIHTWLPIHVWAITEDSSPPFCCASCVSLWPSSFFPFSVSSTFHLDLSLRALVCREHRAETLWNVKRVFHVGVRNFDSIVIIVTQRFFFFPY